MFKRFVFLVLSIGIWCFAHESKAWMFYSSANDTNASNYYPYHSTFADIYLGIDIATIADVSANVSDNPRWGALYNPMAFLDNYGADFMLGVRPLNNIMFFRDIRLEASTQYIESRYKILQDPSLATWVNKEDIPPYGKIILKGVLMFNAYYDMRWFSDIFYPYVGVGVGVGTLKVKALDYQLLASGMGEEYSGSKNVSVQRFMAGIEYDTKIIKASVFLQYSYEHSGNLTIYPRYNGHEADENDKKDHPNKVLAADGDDKGGKKDDHKDSDNDNNNRPTYVNPQPRNLAYTAHSIMFGFKYYLF